ncbi:MAG: YdiU family protein [Pseudomonadota bacterium]
MENTAISSANRPKTNSSAANDCEKSFLSELNFCNRYYKLTDNFQYQLPTNINNPYIININPLMARELDIDHISIDHKLFAQFSSGNLLLDDSDPIASIYAGHQFGQFVPQLGDGRALLLGEIKNKENRYWELQLKGAGKTPFSRDGDGRAVLRSTIREYLCSEAMAGLGIPTTRSLSMVGSTDEVYRESIESAAVMVRMSPSFIRFGSFELFASRGQDQQVKELADFVIKNYYPEINSGSEAKSNPNNNPYQQFFKSVVIKTAELMAKWQAVGFAHGVMNTDNMSILGLTLDYGPFGFLDKYDSQFICNHSDYQGRYRFGNQSYIGFWNLNCLARALMTLISLDEAKQALSFYQPSYQSHYLHLMQQKLGFFDIEKQQHEKLITTLLQLLESNQVDYSLFFRRLSNYAPVSNIEQPATELLEMFTDKNGFTLWLSDYSQVLNKQQFSNESRKIKMNMVNPKYVLRNYIAQIIIEKVDKEKDFGFFDKWLKILQSPYDEHPEMESFAGLPPSWAQEISVSCSS